MGWCIKIKLKKKLEIIEIDDILNLKNQYLSDNLNHYLKHTLFNLRIVFRHNSDDKLDDLIELYYDIENILTCDMKLTKEDIKQLIKKIVNTSVNMDNVDGSCVVYEDFGKLITSLYDELENVTLKSDNNNPNTFNILINILDSDNISEIKEEVKHILKSNYSLEYQEYLARYNL